MNAAAHGPMTGRFSRTGIHPKKNARVIRVIGWDRTSAMHDIAPDHWLLSYLASDPSADNTTLEANRA